MLYILFMEDDPRKTRLRDELFEEHYAYLMANKDLLLLGGAQLQEDGTTRTGSVLILNVPERAIAEAFLAAEPYSKAGLFKTIRLTRMRRALWQPENAPSTPDGN